MMGPTSKKYEIISDEEYERIRHYPKSYDLSDPANVKVFAERLRQARKDYYTRLDNMVNTSEYYNIKHKKKISQSELAEQVGLTAMEISKYERGEIKEIPINRFREICFFLDVTVHYLLGLVDKPEQSLLLDENGDYILKDGKPQVVISPMQCDPPSVVKANEGYRNLLLGDPELYWRINDIIKTPPSLRKQYKRALAEKENECRCSKNDEMKKV